MPGTVGVPRHAPVTGDSVLARTSDRRQDTITLHQQTAGHCGAMITGSRSPACTGYRRQSTGMRRWQAAVCWHTPLTGSRSTAHAGDNLLAPDTHAGKVQQSAGTHCDRLLAAGMHRQQTTGCRHTPQTGSHPLALFGDRQQASGMRHQQAVVCWQALITGVWPPAHTGNRLPLHAANRQQAAGVC